VAATSLGSLLNGAMMVSCVLVEGEVMIVVLCDEVVVVAVAMSSARVEHVVVTAELCAHVEHDQQLRMMSLSVKRPKSSSIELESENISSSTSGESSRGSLLSTICFFWAADQVCSTVPFDVIYNVF
jgi:hypothetical protein